MRRTSLVIISLLLCIALSVPALAAGELDAFQRTANDAAAFSDVPAGSWYEAGVQAVYRRGIMTGTGAKTFAPTQTISWAQAITIAARIHAACTGVEISASDGAWYEPYVSYAAKADLLPSTCPEGAAVSSRTITRQSWQDCLQTFCPRSRCLPSTTAPFRTLPPWTRNFAARSG